MSTAERIAQDLLGLVSPPGRWRCRCGATLELPGICARCAAEARRAEVGERLRLWARELPPHQRDACWSRLHELRRDDGGLRVTTSRPLTPEAVSKLRAQIDGAGRVVVIGPAGAGKSTIVAAALRGQIARSPERRIWYVPAASLADTSGPGQASPLARALAADVLALDDMGAELEGAQVNSGLLAQRVGPAMKVIGDRFERGRKTLVTTGFERDHMAKLYGDRVARRVFEGAEVIRLGAA